MIEIDSSLGRFLDSRGILMAGGNTQRNGFMAQMVIGGVLTIVSIGLTIGAVFGPREMLAGALGPFLAGTINFGIGFHLYRRYQSSNTQSVHLTEQARGILRQLIQIAQSRKVNPWGWQPYGNAPHLMTGVTTWNGPGSPGGRPITNINPEAITLLEETARNFNRLVSLGEIDRASASELSKLAPRLALAAEEGMAESLHHAAMLSLFPEGAGVSKTRIEAINRALAETADRAEAMSVREPSISERLGYRSAVDDVLEELRLTQNAHDELTRESNRSENELRH